MRGESRGEEAVVLLSGNMTTPDGWQQGPGIGLEVKDGEGHDRHQPALCIVY